MSNTHGEHWLQREDLGDVTVVRINLPFLRDDDAAREVFDTINTLVDTMGRNKLVLNLANVKMIYSLGIGKLVLLNSKTRTKPAEGRLVLCNLSPMAAEIIHTSGVDQIIKIHKTEEEAVQALA